jgi:hypothetical protein
VFTKSSRCPFILGRFYFKRNATVNDQWPVNALAADPCGSGRNQTEAGKDVRPTADLKTLSPADSSGVILVLHLRAEESTE